MADHDPFDELLKRSTLGNGEGAPPSAHARAARLHQEDTLRGRVAALKAQLQHVNPVEQADEYNRLFGELLALEKQRADLTDPPRVPDDPTEALQLAADCISSAAGTTLWDRTTLPDEWYRRYGSISQIINALGELANNATSAVPRALVGRTLYVDELGEPSTPAAKLDEWSMNTNGALYGLGRAAGHWAVAHSALGRIGVRLPPEDTEEPGSGA